MNLSDLLNSSVGQSIVKSVAGQFGLDEYQASAAVNTAIPVILGGLNKNVQTPEGAESLNNALESKHDGSLLDNLGGILGGNVGDLLQDGGGILVIAGEILTHGANHPRRRLAQAVAAEILADEAQDGAERRFGIRLARPRRWQR